MNKFFKVAYVTRSFRILISATVKKTKPDRKEKDRGINWESMEGETKKLIQVWLAVIASLCYCYFIVTKIPKGKVRLISLLPVICLFTILPLHLSSVLPTGTTAFFVTWLANYKLLLFSFSLGPLSEAPSKSLFLFISISCLPIKIRQKSNIPNNNFVKAPKIPLNAVAKTLIFALLIGLNDYRESINGILVLILDCCSVFLFVDIILALCNAVVRTFSGLQLESYSDEPYLATSLQDFWGRRWNLMVTNTLRETVYKPVRSLSAGVLGPAAKWAPLPAVLAAFVVSGLMHELLFFYMTRASPTWEVTCFFVFHGVCVVVEVVAKKVFIGKKYRLPCCVSGPLTVGFVVVTSSWLFFPQLRRNGADVRAVEECKALVGFVKDRFKKAKIVWGGSCIHLISWGVRMREINR